MEPPILKTGRPLRHRLSVSWSARSSLVAAADIALEPGAATTDAFCIIALACLDHALANERMNGRRCAAASIRCASACAGIARRYRRSNR